MRARLIPVVVLASICLSGVWLGHRVGKPEPVRHDASPTNSPPRKPLPVRRSVKDLLASMHVAKGEEWIASWEGLGHAQFAELRVAFTQIAADDPNKQRLENRELRWLIQAMVTRDPKAAIAAVREHFHGLKRSHAYFTIIEHWGREDPDATLAFVAGLDASEDSSSNVHNATTGFLHEWAQRDPKAALAAWLDLPEPKLANESSIPYSAECLARGASLHPEMRTAALELLLEQSPSEGRASALAGVLATWTSMGSFEEVRDWFAQQNLNGAEANTIAVAIANSALKEGHADAADWLLKELPIHQSSKHDRANHLDTFAEAWARDDPNGCAVWLGDLSPSEETDWAIRGFLRRVQYIDPATGFEWTRAISGEPLRKRMVQEFWNHWRRTAPVSAGEFTRNLTLEECEWLGINRN